MLRLITALLSWVTPIWADRDPDSSDAAPVLTTRLFPGDWSRF